SGDANIWRYEISNTLGQRPPPTKFIASTEVDDDPQFSLDGQRIVFVSGRSGTEEIWVCDSDGSNPRQLTRFGGRGAGAARWSPDSRQIAFDASPEGNSDIFLVSAEGGRPRRLTTETSNDGVPSWSRDPVRRGLPPLASSTSARRRSGRNSGTTGVRLKPHRS